MDQLKGTSAAFLDVSVGLGNKVGDFDTALNVVKIVLRNSGHAIAKDVKFNVTIEKRTTNGARIGVPVHYTVSESALGFSPGTSEIYRRYVFMSSEEAARVLDMASRLDQIMHVEWSYSYENGFGDTIRGGPICRIFLSDDWIPCENLSATLTDLKGKRR